MKALLLYPRFPQTFWSYNRFMEMAGLKASIPPLGIITVASLLPEDWEIRFHDRNVTEETDAEMSPRKQMRIGSGATSSFSLPCWHRNKTFSPKFKKPCS